MMNLKTQLISAGALLGIVATVLAVVLVQCGGSPALVVQTATLEPTPTPLTEGEKATAAVGQEYIAYRPTRTECEQAADSGEVEACVWFDSARLIVRSEWKRLFPNTDFYLLKLGGYRPDDSLYPYDSRRRLAAWQDDQHYTAETFDRLLEANGVTTITDENRELVAKAFALMTIPDYLEEEVVFT